MIFLLVTLLAMVILSMGSLGIDWGYGSLVKTRLDIAAHSLVLPFHSTHKLQSEWEQNILNILGLNASTTIVRSTPIASQSQIEVFDRTEMPIRSLFARPYFRFFIDSANVRKEKSTAGATQKARKTRTVRALVTAELHPARQVGSVTPPGVSTAGAIPCVLTRAFWEEIGVDQTIAGTMKRSGEILVNGRKVGHMGQYLTYVGQKDRGPKPYNKAMIAFNGYAPIVQAIGEHHFVVGFGHINLLGKLPQLRMEVKISKHGSRNATTHISGDLSHLTKEELSQIFEVNRTLPGVIRAPVFLS